MDIGRIFQEAFSGGVIEEAITIHYNKFTEQGLRVIKNYFKRKGYEVSELKVNDKMTRKDGVPTKLATFIFGGGQVLKLWIAFKLNEEQRKLKKTKLDAAMKKSLGSVFQARVNGTRVPIQMARTGGPMTMKALDTIVEYLKKAEVTKADRKKMVAATQAAEKKAGPRKPTSAAAKLNMAQTRRQDLQTEADKLKKDLDKENKALEKLKTKEATLTDELNELLEGNESLEQQLRAQGSAA